MNKNNYINPRSYGNESTLFINPAKKKLTSNKNQKLSFVIIFCIVFFIFSSIIGYSAYANTDHKQNVQWFIEKADAASIIYIGSKGEIQEEDYLTFMLDSDNCDEIGLTFQITSVMESIPELDSIFQVKIKEHPGDEYVTEASVVGNIVEEDFFLTQLMFHNLVTVKELSEMLDYKDKFEIELIYSNEDHLRDPNIYFDIVSNTWVLKNLNKTITEAQTMCRHGIFNIVEI